jgi:hypothetical protein
MKVFDFLSVKGRHGWFSLACRLAIKAGPGEKGFFLEARWFVPRRRERDFPAEVSWKVS